jgi:hypothetical protein
VREETKIIINNFLKKQFPICRIKDKNHRWKRAIIIKGGYVSKNQKVYDWKRGFNINFIIADLTKVVSNMFGCEMSQSQKIVLKYIEDFKF